MRRHAIPALLVSALAAACSSVPVDEDPAPAREPSASPVTSVRPAGPSSVAATPVSPGLPAHLDPNGSLGREHSIYFDFDDGVFRQLYLSLVDRHARYLVEHPSLEVAVQGNTDERGGSEYNLALGQRRAQAVKTAMQLLGVSDARIEAVSFGEERPAAHEHDEPAWRQNRRADIAFRR